MLPIAITSHLVSGLPKFIFFLDLYSMLSRHLKLGFSSLIELSKLRHMLSQICLLFNKQCVH